jgi:phosphate uptake regulator
MDVEERKIQITGGKTFIVSLPKAWGDSIGLKPGSKVVWVPQPSGDLLLKVKDEAFAQQEVIIHIDEIRGERLAREIIALYIAGFPIIRFKAKRISLEQIEVLKKNVKRLIGPEIIEETSEEVVIQDFLNIKSFTVDKCLKRMYLFATSMHKDALQALIDNNMDLARGVLQRDDEVDRLFLLILRQLSSVLASLRVPETTSLSILDYFSYYEAAQYIERIADHALRISRMVLKLNKKNIPSDFLKKLEKASGAMNEMLNLAFNSLINQDLELADRAINSKQIIEKTLQEADIKLFDFDSDVLFAIGIIKDSIDRSGDYCKNISEIAINRIMIKKLQPNKI